MPAFILYNVQNRQEYSLLDDETAVINNAVFSPDGSKVLYSIDDATAGFSPMMSGTTGIVGLGWRCDGSLFVTTEMGSKAVILRL